MRIAQMCEEPVRSVATAHGEVRLPAYLPVTTFGNDYPVDRLIQPFLPRFADMLMVSYHWARQIETRPKLPLFVDSGGFACLLPGHAVQARSDGTGFIALMEETAVGETDGRDEGSQADRSTELHHADNHEAEGHITPEDVLTLQNRVADFGSTLDFPIPSHGISEEERGKRMSLTLENANWVLGQQTSVSRMFGSVQGWDVGSYVACAEAMVRMGFRDLAVGGLVPRAREKELVLMICRGVAAVLPKEGMLHVFGVGEPGLVESLFAAGATSTDSSSYVRSAVSGRQWDGTDPVKNPSALERAHAALSNLRYAVARSGGACARQCC